MFDTIIVALVHFAFTFAILYVGVLLIASFIDVCCDWRKNQRRRAAEVDAELDRQAAALQRQIHVLAADLDGDRDLAIRRMAAIADALSGSSKRS